MTVKSIVQSVVETEQVDSILHKHTTPSDYECLEVVVEKFSSKCFHIGKVHACLHTYISNVGNVEVLCISNLLFTKLFLLT